MNSLLNGGPGSFGGVKIIEDRNMTDPEEDWSGCRSIPRAKRRHAKGIRTRMRIMQVPKKEAYAMHGGRTLVMHPELARIMRDQLNDSSGKRPLYA